MRARWGIVVAFGLAACARPSGPPPAEPTAVARDDLEDDVARRVWADSVSPSCEDAVARRCGLVVDRTSREDAEAEFPVRYPLARAADVAGACRAADLGCDLREVERRWLLSHNEEVAVRARLAAAQLPKPAARKTAGEAVEAIAAALDTMQTILQVVRLFSR